METGLSGAIYIAVNVNNDGEMAVSGSDFINKGMALDIIEHLAKAFDISVVITISE